MLLVDTREPKALQRALATRLRSEEVLLKALDSADYVVLDRDGQAVGIERKTVSDWLASLAGTRMRTQSERMERTYPVCILLLEGSCAVGDDGKLLVGTDYGVRPSGWSHAAYQMAMLALQHHHGFYVLFTADQEGTIDTLRVLHEHITKRSMRSRSS